MSDYSSELAFAAELAALGAKIALGHFKRDPKAKKKPDGTWVTEGDWAAEAQIRLRIARSRPQDNILGEEEGLTAAGGGRPNEGAPTWIIDPIDGTHNYMAGIPIWATLVALRIEGRTVAGVCNAPALGEIYDAAPGSGARLNGHPIHVAPVDELAEATVFVSGAKSFLVSGLDELYDSLTRTAWRSRGFGDFWGHMLVARGAGHVMVDPDLKIWDVAALEPIVTEAGGRITGISGDPWTNGCTITTCGTLHDQVLALAPAP
jgi:histidinol-phosphatase